MPVKLFSRIFHLIGIITRKLSLVISRLVIQIGYGFPVNYNLLKIIAHKPVFFTICCNKKLNLSKIEKN